MCENDVSPFSPTTDYWLALYAVNVGDLLQLGLDVWMLLWPMQTAIPPLRRVNA
jgi:hypothetical protein